MAMVQKKGSTHFPHYSPYFFRQNKKNMTAFIDFFSTFSWKNNQTNLPTCKSPSFIVQENVNKNALIKKSPSNSFFMSMKPTLYLAQIFGLFPIIGLSGRTCESLRYKLVHWKTLYTLLSLLGSLFLLAFSFIQGYHDDFTFDRAAPIMFYGTASIASILFFKLSRSWPLMNKHFTEIEKMLLPRYGYPRYQNLIFTIFVILFCILAFVEHYLSKLVEFKRLKKCWEKKDLYQSLDTYFLNQYYQVFSVINFNVPAGLFIFVSNVLCTFNWNFMDLFLSLIGLSLSFKLRQINKELRSVKGQQKSGIYWRRIREEYNAISNLVRLVDRHVGKIIVVSIGNNLFFICLQLFKGLKSQINAYQIAYFFWSFGFLIIRAVGSTLCLSQIYEESKEGKSALFSVPYDGYCPELKRFLEQINTDEVVLTGCKFFSVTRGLILGVVGTIATYEIVLVQFKTDIGGITDWSEVNETTYCAHLPTPELSHSPS